MGGVWSYHEVLQIQGMPFADYFDIDGLQILCYGDALNGTAIREADSIRNLRYPAMF